MDNNQKIVLAGASGIAIGGILVWLLKPTTKISAGKVNLSMNPQYVGYDIIDGNGNYLVQDEYSAQQVALTAGDYIVNMRAAQLL